jgi:hypothetical protein
MKSRRWKWIGLGAIAAIAAGTVIASERRRRHWRTCETDEIRRHLHERFAVIDGARDRTEP